MSLVSELKRRNVFRAAIAYLATSWLLLQIGETLLPVYGFGDAAIRLVVAALAICFIPTVAIAWLFELTPDGLKRESEVDRTESITHLTGQKLDRMIIVVLALAIFYFAFDKFVITEFRLENARQEGRVESLVESFGKKSIAVLPFLDMSPAGDQEYMSDGVAEELLNLLAKVPDLRVISRSSSFSFKGAGVSVPNLAARLNVSYVLEGSVRKSGDRVRITAQLIEARSDTHLWSETFERELVDIFAIQDEIAERVVDKLEVTLLGTSPKARQTSPETYALFLQARYLHEQPTDDSYMRALDYYKAAVEQDATYVPAWVWLAALYDDNANGFDMSYEEVGRLAHDAIDRALAIDPDDPLALGMSAIIIAAWDQDLETATARIQRAVDLDPTNPILLRWAALFMPAIGKYDDAVRINEYLLSRDPVGNITTINLAVSYIDIGQYDKAIEICEIQMSVITWASPCRVRLTIAYAYSGDGDSALEQLELIDSPIARLRLAPLVYHTLGDKDKFDTALAALHDSYDSENPRATNRLAMAYAFVGDVDTAFYWLERALDEGAFNLLPDDMDYANLHDDPRWEPLMAKAGLSADALAGITLNVVLPN